MGGVGVWRPDVRIDRHRAAAEMKSQPESRGIMVRLFVTCWLIYGLHVATNTVREVYLALAIGDHLSFRVDEYQGLHPDLFEKPGFGWHINSNPGASFIAAIPYAIFRPAVQAIADRVQRQRKAAGQTEPPEYNSPWPLSRAFYREAWRRGLDVKFGLAAIIMQFLCMAPVSAAGVCAMFFVLRGSVLSETTALWLALLYAFGTPVFFRTGYLNQNSLVAHIGFLGFAVIRSRAERCNRWFAAGLAGGCAILLDYSGLVVMGALLAYALWGAARRRLAMLCYSVGASGPIALLAVYQWASFGNPLFPAQHWMPSTVLWNGVGYHGFGWPQWDMLLANAFDYRYGLFASCPILLLAIAAPFVNRRWPLLARRDVLFCWLTPAALWVFASCIGYSRLQFNTGVRYLVPAVPFLFILVSTLLVRMSTPVVYFLAVIAVTQAWCMAMYRDVERGLGVLDPMLHVFAGGFTLPVLSVASRLGSQFGDYFASGPSPIPLFVLTAALLFGIWNVRLYRHSGN